MKKKEPTAGHAGGLSQLEFGLIADALATAEAEFAEHSCNDFSFPATAAHRAVGAAIVRHREGQGWDAETAPATLIKEMNAAKQKIVVPDFWAADYFASACKARAAGAAASLAAAELAIIAELLESSADEHAGWYGDQGGDLDITLSARPDQQALLAAVLEQQAPRGWKTKLARLKTASAAATPVAPKAAARATGALPTIERVGVAPRFPQIKPHLKAYFQLFKEWQAEDLPLLKRYGGGKADATLRPNGNVTKAFGAACRSLHACALALQWHAVQTALGGGAAGTKEKTKRPDLKTTEREFGKLVQGGQHVHMGIPSARNAADLADVAELEDGEEITAQLEKEIAQAEFMIVRHLLLNHHAPENVEQAFLAHAPELTARKGKHAPAYVAGTMERAAADPSLRKWREQNQAAQIGAAAYQGEIGVDWLAAWRRSVAYDYWSSRMAAHSGRMSYWIYNLLGTATYCLVLGWQEEALALFRQVLAHMGEGRLDDLDLKKKPFFERRTQYFLLRLIADWEGRPALKLPPQADDEPLFAALLAHWQTPDAEALAPLLLAACDRHTHQAVKKKDSPDFAGDAAVTYYPFEILAVLRLRQLRGLKNPTLEHPLMATPLGTLPEATQPYTDELLTSVVVQARLEYADL